MPSKGARPTSRKRRYSTMECPHQERHSVPSTPSTVQGLRLNGPQLPRSSSSSIPTPRSSMLLRLSGPKPPVPPHDSELPSSNVGLSSSMRPPPMPQRSKNLTDDQNTVLTARPGLETRRSSKAKAQQQQQSETTGRKR